MKLSFFKGLSWLIALNIIVKPVWIFFIDRQVQLTIGNEAYGSYFAILNLSYVLFFLSDAGLSNMLNQQIAGKTTFHIWQLFRLKVLLLILYAVVCLVAGSAAGITQWTVLYYVIGIQALTSLFIFLRSIITAHQYFTADAIFSVIDKLLMTVICGMILYSSFFGKLTLAIFLQVQVSATAAAVLASIFFLEMKEALSKQRKEQVMVLLKQMAPFAFIILLMATHYRLDGFLVERISGAEEAGIYALGFRLLDAGNMVGYLTASFLVPFFARNHTDKYLLQNTILGCRHILIPASMGIMAFALVFAPWIQQVLYHTTIPYRSLVLQLSLSTLPAYYLMHIYGSLLTATRKFSSFLSILVVAVVLNLILNLILIPRYGAVGSAIASIVSQYACAIVIYYHVTKGFALSFGSRANFYYLLWTAAWILFFYGASLVIKNVWVILATAAVISLLILFVQRRHLKKYFISIA